MNAASNKRAFAVSIAVLLALSAAFVIALASEDSDAARAGIGPAEKTEWYGFKENNAGTLLIPLALTDADSGFSVLVTVENKGETVYKEVFVLPDDMSKKENSGDGINGVLKLSFILAPGNNDVIVTAMPYNQETGEIMSADGFFKPGGNTIELTIGVKSSVWSGVGIYAAIAVVALIVVAGAAIYIRSKPKSTAGKMTFTELAASKNKETAESDKKEETTRRKYYAGSAKEKKPQKTDGEADVAAAKPKTGIFERKTEKKMTFTELEAQKKSEENRAEPSDVPSKEKSTEKIKYRSSRRK